MATNFEPHEYVIFVQSTKIGIHENKAIHSILRDSRTQDNADNFCSFYWMKQIKPGEAFIPKVWNIIHFQASSR